MLKQGLRLPIEEVFYIVYTCSEDGTFVQEDYCEEIFSTTEAAEEYAQQIVEEDGNSRVIVKCESVSIVMVPKPVVQIKSIKPKVKK